MDKDTLPQKLQSWRHTLHRYPDLSGAEESTAFFLAETLKAFNPTRMETGLGGAGLAVFFEQPAPGPTLLFRAELDALPITETNRFEHRSTREGVAHLCGHDGHMAMLLGLAAFLQAAPLSRGRIILLFQPAEETGEGARRVLEDPRVAGWKPDWVFAAHNIPGEPLGTVLIRTGSFTAQVISVVFSFQGKTAHAGEPEQGINPAGALAEALVLPAQMNRTDIHRDDFRLLTPIFAQLGEKAYGTSAGAGEAHFTLRTWTAAEMEKLQAELLAQIRSLAERHHLEVAHTWLFPFYANQNDAAAVEWIKKAAEKENMPLKEKAIPFRWGEDFGLFTQRYPGAMIGLGAGTDTAPLHRPDYDFPDALTEKGARFFYRLAQQILA